MTKEKREFLAFRLVFMVLFWIFLKISLLVTAVIALIQWVVQWFQEEPIESLFRFSSSLLKFQSAILAYLTFQSDEKVFPFRDWPDGDA
ncbi:DUF4389 domain-containing protein [Reinekea marinisedimentorum]|uniref:Uncharacterized protein DUF4389 n=1 Tax=Reinekea marinisedimentorum TaxID=230495 RepID=A0A4R3I3R6_9GAMM|nr:DUF4389 domain-containing protein [Reinekea marinisedimentorum]TCS39934.1 uncharacterized protein DUF4389 [Reinekea marinisedimentorum]